MADESDEEVTEGILDLTGVSFGDLQYLDRAAIEPSLDKALSLLDTNPADHRPGHCNR